MQTSRPDDHPSPSASASPSDPVATTSDRSRTIHACETCRRRKTKCDGLSPCTRCVSAGRQDTCVYTPFIKRTRSSRPPISRPIVPEARPLKRKLSVHVQAGPEEASLTDKGHQELRAGVAAFHPESNAYQFYGASSHWSFVQRLYQRIRPQSDKTVSAHTRELPEGLKQWGFEKQLFTRGNDNQKDPQHDAFDFAYLPRELGDSFIATYFEIMHGQAPILDQMEVEKTWQGLWIGPGNSPHSRPKDRSILYMVFAIGARLRKPDNQDDNFLGWADHFYEKAGKNLGDCFEETTLRDCHLLLLRGIYATQAGKSNWIYLYMGHAARSAMALGLHRAQVVGGADEFSNRLRLTFWTIYYVERMTSILSGRPSNFVDENIDAPYPIDISNSSNNGYAYIRAMVAIAKITGTVVTTNYTPKHAKRLSDLSDINRSNYECIGELERIVEMLPPHLRFSDHSAPVLDTSTEVQRLCLGATYYITQTLIFRSALIYATFFESLALAQDSLGEHINLKRDTDLAISAAKNLVLLAHDGFFRRCPSFQRDGNISFFIISACITLLFEVLHPAATPAHATDVFHIVEKGLQCLDKIDHVGSTTGRAISLDVMAIAKAALFSTEGTTRLESTLMEDFQWLGNEFDMNVFEGLEGLVPDAGMGMSLDMDAWWSVMNENFADATALHDPLDESARMA